MKDGTITIYTKDEQVTVELDIPQEYPDFILAMYTALLGTAKNVIAQVPDIHKDAVTKDIHDMLNYGASNLLSILAPDLELRPELTEKAILEMENKLIMEEYSNKIKH